MKTYTLPVSFSKKSLIALANDCGQGAIPLGINFADTLNSITAYQNKGSNVSLNFIALGI